MDNEKTYCLKEKKLTGNYDIKTITLIDGQKTFYQNVLVVIKKYIFIKTSN